MILIILLASLTQYGNSDTNKEKVSLETITDRQFVEAQENWVIDSMDKGHPMRGLAPMFGLKVERYAESLSCLHSGCRETAVERFEEMGEDAIRPLIWASRHKNKAVAKTANYLLYSFFICPLCNGEGLLGEYYLYPCDMCNGSGNLRKKWAMNQN